MIQSRTRTQIRQSIGYNLNDVIISTATSSTALAASALVDTKGLALGGDDEYNGRQVYFYAVAGTTGNAAGQWSYVSDFVASSRLATLSPALTATVVVGDSYEMWRTMTIGEVNSSIDDAITEVTDDALQIKQTSNTWTEWDRKEYNVLSGFVGVSKVEYVGSVGDAEVLDECDQVWTSASTASIAVSLNNVIARRGAYCNQFAIAGTLAASTLIASHSITETDLSNYDTIELWAYSDDNIAASALAFVFDDTAACASPIERLDFPALTAHKWTRCEMTIPQISGGAPTANTAIISVGLYKNAAFGGSRLVPKVYIDYVLALKSSSRVFKELNPELWTLNKAGTTTLKITQDGLNVADQDTLLRITGYQIPSLLSADTAISQIDPSYLIARATGQILMSHAKSAMLDIKDKKGLGNYWLAEAERKKSQIRTRPAPNTRWTS